MKKIGLFLTFVLLCGSFIGYSQTKAIIINEKFDGAVLPEGWEIQNAGQYGWVVDAGNNAEGEAAGEIYYNAHYAAANQTGRIIMGTHDLSGITELNLEFMYKTMLLAGLQELTYGFATSPDGGTTWNSAWETVEEDYMPNGALFQTTVTSPDFGSPNVMLCFYASGNWTDPYAGYVYMDDILITAADVALDAELVSVDMPQYLAMGDHE